MESRSELKWENKKKVQKWVNDSYFDGDLREWIHKMARKYAKILHEGEDQTSEEIEMALTNISIRARISWVWIFDKVLDWEEYREIFKAEVSTYQHEWVKECKNAIKQLSIRLLDFSPSQKKDREALSAPYTLNDEER